MESCIILAGHKDLVDGYRAIEARDEKSTLDAAISDAGSGR